MLMVRMAPIGKSEQRIKILIMFVICRYMLYQFLIMDGMGGGRTVMIGFVRSETYECLHSLMVMFREMMGDLACRGLQTFVVDKMAAQMRAITDVFHCDLLLCYFHLRQAVKRKVCLTFTYAHGIFRVHPIAS